jgi:arylsulfatase A-like enzyme
MAGFNICFWTLTSTLSGCVLVLITQINKSFERNEHLGWTVFFLLPFAWLAVYLGLAETAVGSAYENVPFFTPLSAFFWALLVPIFLILRFARNAPTVTFSPFAFIPEIIVILLLAHFTANTAQIALVSLPYNAARQFFTAIGITQPLYLFLAYCAGIVIIYGLYVYSMFRFKRFYQTPRTTALRTHGNVRKLTALFAALIVFVAAAYAINSLKRRPSAVIRHIEESNSAPVILIVLDTVRAENLALYGYPADHNHLAAFARDALVFEKCIANSPWTLPSHASMFTGLTPNEHGAHGDLQADSNVFGIPFPRPLADDFETLAEIFQKNKYWTIGVVSNNIALDSDMNVHQGFDVYECFGNVGDLSRKNPFRPMFLFFSYILNMPDYFMNTMRAGQITDRCIKLTETSTNTPFFLFVNYMDAHLAYCPPRPYNSFYTDRRFPHLYRLETHARRKFLKHYDQNAWNIFTISQYDGAIAYLDDQLGRFFEHLKRAGIYDRALIIITSDHGELFGEHEFYGHRTPMYEGAIRVPLIIKLPYSEQAGRNTNREIQLHDLFSTILSICGLNVPESLSGRPYGVSTLPSVAEYENRDWRQHRVLYDGQYKYFYYERERSPELYDLHRDPLENSNIAVERTDIVEMMNEKLKKWVNDHPPRYDNAKDAEVSQETVRGLKALGYIQ